MVVLLVCGFTGCTTEKQPVVAAPDQVHPKIAELSFGGAFGEQGRYVADGVHVYQEVYRPHTKSDGSCDYPLKRQVEASPTNEQWSKFWNALKRLDVVHWKAEYLPNDIGMSVNDGMQWWLNTSTRTEHYEFKGDNAYPAYKHPEKATLDDATFRSLQQAFEELLHSEKEGPSPLPMKMR